jgi:hypothetical protein
VAALTANNRERTSAASCKWPWRSMASISPGMACFAPFAAEPIGDLPHRKQGLSDRFIVEPGSRLGHRSWLLLARTAAVEYP